MTLATPVPVRVTVARAALVTTSLLVVLGTVTGADAMLLAAAAPLYAGLVLMLGRLRRATLLYVVGLLTAAGALVLTYPEASEGVAKGLSNGAVFAAFMLAVILTRNTVVRHPALSRMQEQFATIPAADRNGGLFVTSHMLGSVMTFGCLALMAPIFGGAASVEARRDNALIILRALSLVVFWSPFTVAVAITLQMMPDLPAWMLFAAGAVTVVVALAISVARREIRVTASSLVRVVRPLVPILGALAIPVVAIFVLPPLFDLSSLATVALVLPVFCVGWLLLLDPAAVWPTMVESARQVDTVLGEVTFFACSILLAEILGRSTGFLALLGDTIAIHDPNFWHFAGASLGIVAACMLGVHMVVPASIVLAVLGPQIEGPGPQLAFALLVLFAWCAGSMLTVASVSMLSTASAFRVPLGRLIRSPNLAMMATLGAVLFAAAAVLTSL